MLLTELMLRVNNVEPKAELRNYGYGQWVIEAPAISKNGQSRITALVKLQTKTVAYHGSIVNEVVFARVRPNTERRRAVKTWLALWGINLR